MSIEGNSNAAEATNRLEQQVEYGRVADVERLFESGFVRDVRGQNGSAEELRKETTI